MNPYPEKATAGGTRASKTTNGVRERCKERVRRDPVTKNFPFSRAKVVLRDRRGRISNFLHRQFFRACHLYARARATLSHSSTNNHILYVAALPIFRKKDLRHDTDVYLRTAS